MTIEQFIEECREAGIRFERDADGLLRDQAGKCPICALVAAKWPDMFTTNEEAAWYGTQLLGLSLYDADSIMIAADLSSPDKARQPIRRMLEDLRNP